MTVANTPRNAGPYLGDGTTVALPFTFKVFQDTDVLVQRNNADGSQVALTLGSAYVVTLNANQNVAPGGVVAIINPAVNFPSGCTIRIGSQVAQTQPTSLANGGPYLASQVEDALDRVTILQQQIQLSLQTQALRVPDLAGVPQLPSAGARANRVLGFDANGDPIVLPGVDANSAAALATDLASTTQPSKGAAMVGFYDPVAPAFAKTLGDIASGVPVDLRRFISKAEWPAIAAGTSILDVSSALNTAATATRRIDIPPGKYRCNSSVTLRQDSQWRGWAKQNTTIEFIGAAGLLAVSSGLGAYDLVLSGFGIKGDGSGSGRHGLHIDGTASNFGRATLEDLLINGFSGDGLRLTRPIVSTLRNIQSSLHGGSGFNYLGDGTSVTSIGLYAYQNGADGHRVTNNLQYSTWIGCASDSNAGNGYNFLGTSTSPAEGITLISCGSEVNQGDQFRFGGTMGLTLNSIFTFPGSPSIGGHFINLDGCRHVLLSGIRMERTAPAGKVALNIGSLGGTQFPVNVRKVGCSFSSIASVNSALLDLDTLTANTSAAWIAPTLTNSWVNFGSGQADAGYYRDQFGVVFLKGVIKSGTIGQSAFTLPAGYRPASRRQMAAVSNGAFGYLSIDTTGTVTPVAGSNLSFSLDGLSFLGEA